MLDDQRFIKRAVELAYLAKERGDNPYGSLLVDDRGNILIEGMNTQNQDNDISAHSELNVIKEATKIYDKDFLAKCTLYNSGEPCTMCTGAIFWSGIKRVVYGISKAQVDQITKNKVNIKYSIHDILFGLDIEVIQISGMDDLIFGPHL